MVLVINDMMIIPIQVCFENGLVKVSHEREPLLGFRTTMANL